MKIFFKKIEEDDLEFLRNWRMQENVTKYMITDPIITKESQIEWYSKIINDKSRVDYVIMCDNKRIGYYGITNIDKTNSSCEIGFYIGEKEYRGKGIFKIIQQQIEDIVFNNLNLNKIIISVLGNNPIIEAYKKNGFIENESLKRQIFKYNIKYDVIYLYKSKDI